MDPVNAEENLIISLGEDVKTLAEEESRRRIDKLLNTGHDVLNCEYERDGPHVVYSRRTENKERGSLDTQCFDQDQPQPAVWSP